MKAIRFLIVFCFLLLTGKSVSGQDLGSWNILNLKRSLNEKWMITAEGQLRSLKFYRNFHYYEVTGTASYQPSPYFRWTLGGGSYQTYGEGGDFVRPKNQEEWRLWPQVTLLQPLHSINLEHRYRLEMRFTDKGYRNRYRYRFGMSVPLGHAPKNFRLLQLTGSSEIFFTDKEPYFERIRVIAGVNYRFSDAASVVTGYLYQFDYKLTDEIGRDFLLLGIYYEFNHKRTGTLPDHVDH
ncbi:MAG: DUF2490 domain-containing protein [Cyclobacteriaceae bacterium]